MTIAELHPPHTRRFSRDEYYRMAEQGFFDNQRVELIDGEIVEMPAQHEPHVWAVSQLIQHFAPQIRPPYMLRCQAPLSIGNSDPEPDLAIVMLPTPADTAPHTAALVIEVAESSLALDRQKAHLYASAQIPEYWLVNLNERMVERHTNPSHDPASPYSAKYADVSRHLPAESLQPRSLPFTPATLASLFLP